MCNFCTFKPPNTASHLMPQVSDICNIRWYQNLMVRDTAQRERMVRDTAVQETHTGLTKLLQPYTQRYGGLTVLCE